MKGNQKKENPAGEWPLVYPDAAGLDIGGGEIWACVPADRADPAVRCFSTFTRRRGPIGRGTASGFIGCAGSSPDGRSFSKVLFRKSF
jgi:hypothetical protein